MNEILLNIWCDGTTQTVPMHGTLVTIGRGEQANICVSDQRLSRVHASIHRDGERVWVLDEGSTNGTFVNSQPVSATGTVLQNGDQIALGSATKITVNFSRQAAAPVLAAPPVTVHASTTSNGNRNMILPVLGAVIAVVGILAVATVLAVRWRNEKIAASTTATPMITNEPSVMPSLSATPAASPTVQAQASAPTFPANNAVDNTKLDEQSNIALEPVALTALNASELRAEQFTETSHKLYKQLSEREQVYYVYQKAKAIGKKVGTREAEFPDEGIKIIKYWLDAYVRRIGTGNTRIWAEDLNAMFWRARTNFVPTILRAFKANNAPPVVGVYLPVIETEYRNISTENFAGAAGLFQFIPDTARGYGVDPSERTNIEKMAPAAARYINHRLAEFGADAVGVGLSIAGYNRSPDSVRRDLHDVIDSQNPARDFWILVKNQSKLDHWFQRENINYPPRFFAAAIIGEHPWDFGVQMRNPLSTYSTAPKSITD